MRYAAGFVAVVALFAATAAAWLLGAIFLASWVWPWPFETRFESSQLITGIAWIAVGIVPFYLMRRVNRWSVSDGKHVNA